MKIFASLICLAAVSFSSAAMAESAVRLCTGAADGVYAAAGGMIQKMAGNALPVVIVETEGTIDNMDRMLTKPATDPEACDAMIAQPDGPVYLARKSPASTKKIRQVASLHREYLHGLCNKKSGVEDIGDLENDPEKYSIAIGAQGSGAWLIWQNITAEDDDYGAVPVTNDGGVDALASVASDDGATCMLVPAGLKNGTVNEADATFGDSLVLVGANDGDFDDALDIKGSPLYEYAKIPGGSYPRSFNYWSDVKTISWLAGVYINTDRLNGKRATAFTLTAARAANGIKAEYGK